MTICEIEREIERRIEALKDRQRGGEVVALRPAIAELMLMLDWIETRVDKEARGPGGESRCAACNRVTSQRPRL